MNLELKAAIVRKFGSQANFAVVAKADEPFISRVVRGRKELPAEDRQRWADLLGCRPGEIFRVGAQEECQR